MFVGIFSTHFVAAVLISASGMANPLVFAYLLEGEQLRLRLGILIVVGVIASLPALGAANMTPLKGYPVWILSVILLLASRFSLGPSPFPEDSDQES